MIAGEGVKRSSMERPWSPISGASASIIGQEDWKQEVKIVLSSSFQQQLQELRDFCKEMRIDAKEEMQRFLQNSNTPMHEKSARMSSHMDSPTLLRPPVASVVSQESTDVESIEVVTLALNRSTIGSVPTGDPALSSLPGAVEFSEDRPYVDCCADTVLSQVTTQYSPHVPTGVAASTRGSTSSRKSIANRGGDTLMSSTRSSNQKGRQNLRQTIKMLEFPPPRELTRAPTWFHQSKMRPFFDAAEALVNSFYFDYFMGLLLSINAIIMGFSVDVVAVDGLDDTPTIFKTLDLVFNVVFSIELLVRVLAFRDKFFRIEGWRWNVFDAVIAVLGWTHIVVNLLNTDSVVNNFGVLRFLKLGRVARLVRMVRLIPELKSMVYLMIASMSSFIWALMLMMIVIYCMAVYFTELASDLKKEANAPNTLGEHWGSLPQSILSLYMGITGGDDWVRLIEPFKANANLYIISTGVFSVYIAFATLVMLNLVTGVFVESAQRIIKEEKDNEIMNMAAKLFLDADNDHSQDITLEEWSEQLNTGNLDAYIKAVGISRAEASKLFELLDLDESGTINIAEFVHGCVRLRGPAKAMDMADMLHSMRKQSVETHKQILSLHASIKLMAESRWQCRTFAEPL